MTPDVFCKALSEETRARITLLLADKHELCVCDLTMALATSQPKISRHLAQLRRAGLLLDRRAGQWVFYRLHPQLPSWALEILTILRGAQETWLEQNLERLNVRQTIQCC